MEPKNNIFIKNKKIFLVLISIVLYPLSFIPYPLFAIDSKAGTSGAAFLKIPAGSARAQSLGNCGVSSIEGAEAMSINPAGIASSQLKEIGFSHISWFEDYSGNYLAYVHPIGQSVIGINAAYQSTSKFDARDAEGKPQYGDDIKIKNGYASLSIAKALFLEKLLLGLSVKGILEDNYKKEYKNTVFDAGIIFKLGRKFSIGWANQNMSGDKEDVVQIQRLGLALSLNPFWTFLIEKKDYSDNKSRTGGGLEFNLPEELLHVGRVSLRVGYTSSDRYGQSYDDDVLERLGLDNTSGWSFGFGIYSSQALGYGMGIDYAMVPYGALGKSNQIAIRFQF
jgi:hypothetical protein